MVVLTVIKLKLLSYKKVFNLLVVILIYTNECYSQLVSGNHFNYFPAAAVNKCVIEGKNFAFLVRFWIDKSYCDIKWEKKKKYPNFLNCNILIYAEW